MSESMKQMDRINRYADLIIVFADIIQSNVAGFEMTVAILREILEAVLGIEIGDEIIGEAAIRYNRRIALRNGGTSV